MSFYIWEHPEGLFHVAHESNNVGMEICETRNEKFAHMVSSALNACEGMNISDLKQGMVKQMLKNKK